MSVLRRRVLLGLLIVSGILNYADRQIIAILKPLLQDELHWTDPDYGRLTAIFQFAAAFAYLGAGWVVDRLGWRRANTVAVGSWSLAAMAHTAARTMGEFTLARLALGATESLGTPSSVKTIAVLYEPKGRSMALGAMNAAANVGAIVTPLFVPALALAWGWKAAFLITGGLGLAWAACWAAVASGGSRIAPMGSAAAADATGQAPAGGSGSAAVGRPGARPAVRGVAATTGDPDEPPVRWRSVLTDRRTWAIAGAKILSDQVWWFLLYWAPDFFHRIYQLDVRGFATPLALIYGAAALGSILGGSLSGRLIARGVDVVKAHHWPMLICAILAVPVALAPVAGNLWLAVGILGLTLAAHQGFSVNLFALTTHVTPSSQVATVISVGALFGNLSGMVILQAAGWLIGEGRGYGPLFGLAAVSYLLALGWVRWVLPAAPAPRPSLR